MNKKLVYYGALVSLVVVIGSYYFVVSNMSVLHAGSHPIDKIMYFFASGNLLEIIRFIGIVLLTIGLLVGRTAILKTPSSQSAAHGAYLFLITTGLLLLGFGVLYALTNFSSNCFGLFSGTQPCNFIASTIYLLVAYFVSPFVYALAAGMIWYGIIRSRSGGSIPKDIEK